MFFSFSLEPHLLIIYFNFTQYLYNMAVSFHLLNALVQFVFILPFLFFGKEKFIKDEFRLLGIFAIMFLLWSVLTNGLGGVIVNSGQKWQWVGKVAGLLLGIFFVYRNKLISKKELGWTLRFNVASVKPVLSLLLLILAARLSFYLLFEPISKYFDLETVLFQGVLVGFCDELLFRGILLALLNRIFSGKENLFGFPLSFGILITSVLYGLTQGFILGEGFHLQINLIRILLGFFVGLIAALLKERSGSLLPAVIFHNIWSLIANH